MIVSALQYSKLQFYASQVVLEAFHLGVAFNWLYKQHPYLYEWYKIVFSGVTWFLSSRRWLLTYNSIAIMYTATP